MTSPSAPPAAGDRGHDALAADGTIVRIRPVVPADSDRLRRLYDRTSDENLYRRFMVGGRTGLVSEVRRLIRPGGADHMAVLASARDQVIGVGSFERLTKQDAAEFAVLVDDAWHGRGVGTLLLEELAALARRRGIGELVGDVLAGNGPMLRVAGDLGPRPNLRQEAGVVEIRVRTTATDGGALEFRDQQAERHSLTPLLAPAAVAVVGAGRTPGGVGHEILTSLTVGGFRGPVYPVNPNASEVAGQPAYPDLTALPGPVDLAIIAVPAAAVPGALEQAAQAGVRAVVVVSTGFGESGPAGRAAQAELVRTARRAGVRLVGPNCLGVLNTDPRVRLSGTFAAVVPPAGGLAVATQSGAVGITILDHAARTGTGLSSFVSLGNKADVSGNDLLSYWYDDPATRAVALYLESVGNPRRFARIARATARRKPVLVIKAGRTVSGSRAGVSHTAAAAAPDATIDALFAQAGVVRCDSLGDLLATARILTDQPLPAGARLAVLGNAGGMNVLAADAAESAGLTVPELSEAVQQAIAVAAPEAVAVANPVDLGAGSGPAALAAAVTAVATSDEVDALLITVVATLANDVAGLLKAAEGSLDQTALPCAVVLLGVPDAPAALGERRVPVYDLPEQAVGAIGRAARYAAWRATPLGRLPVLPGLDPGTARAIVNGQLGDGGGWLAQPDAVDLLGCYGIPVLGGRVVTDAGAAVRAAEAIGYPVVLKVADPAVVHKSELGGVLLGLTEPAAVRAGYAAVVAATGCPQVLVQRQVAAGVELAAGVVHDPLFGSLVMLGLGGVRTDLLDDRTLRLPPVTDVDAAAMWRGLRSAPVLTGYRGTPAVHTAALEDVLQRLGQLAEDLPEIAELDLNPLMASPEGVLAVDVKLRLAEVGTEPDPGLRALREPG